MLDFYRASLTDIRKWLAKEGSVSDLDASGRTPLHLAVALDKVDAVRLLVDAGADPNVRRNGNGRTPLHVALWSSERSIKYEIVRILLAAGADPDIPDDDNETALHLAADAGDLPAVRLLLNAGANPNWSDDEEEVTPLHLAACRGAWATVRLLLNAGANLDAADKRGHTPLDVAIAAGHKDGLVGVPQRRASDPVVKRPDFATASPAEVNAWIGATRNLETAGQNGLTPLQSAVLEDNPIAVRLLLEAGAEVHGLHGIDQLPLPHDALRYGRPEILWLLHAGGAELDRPDRSGRTALHWAASTGRGDHLRLLLELGADPNAVDDLGWSALHASALKGDSDMAQDLTEKGGRHDLLTVNGESPMALAGSEEMTAALKHLSGLKAGRYKRKKHSNIPKRMSEGFNFSRGSEQEILEWIRSGGHPDVWNDSSDPPLFRLAEIGSAQAIKELLDAGALCDPTNRHDCTPLGWAAYHGNSEGVRVLLDAGSNIEGGTNDPNDQFDGITPPLQLAAMNGHAQTVQMLLDAGADINAINNEEQTTALHAAAEENQIEIAKLLIEAGVALDITDHYSYTPLCIAASAGKAKMVELLLGAGADPVVHDSNDGTALHRAAYAGHSNVVKLLIEHSPWMATMTTGWNETPLHFAAWNGNPRSVAALLEHGAAETLNSKGGENGDTPLHWAIAQGNTEVEAALIEAGADTRIKNYKGKTCGDMRDAGGYDDDDFDF